MTIQSNKLFIEGRNLWQEYLNLNDYAFEPTEDGLKKLAQKLKLTKSYIRQRIHCFLSA
jgi:hypothetical protein